MPQWGTKKSSNNRVDREVRTGKGMNSQPSRESEGCWIDVAAGGDSSPAAGERDEVCVTARVSRRRREVAGVPASGAFGDSIACCWARPYPTGIHIGPRTKKSRK